MATITRKRKAINPFNASKPSGKRLRTLRSHKDAVHPFTQLPSELQLRIMGFCDQKTLAAFSLLSNYFRELSLRIMWETQPVETYIKNFDQLDEHEDLRLAVRHLAIRNQSAPNPSRFSGVTKRLLARIPKNYFPGLTEFTIEYQNVTLDYFAAIMNSLAAHQPKRLKTLNIKNVYRWYKPSAATANQTGRQDNIVYPTGLTTISVQCPPGAPFGQPSQADPLEAFDANSDTVTTAKLYVGSWIQSYSLKPCPKVTTLFARQDQFDRYYAKQLATKFPNTEYLILDAPYCGTVPVGANQSMGMEKYAEWRVFSSVKSVKLTYTKFVRYDQDSVTFRNSVIDNISFLVKRWISDGHMPSLEVVDVWAHCGLFDLYPARTEDTKHSFTLHIEIKDAVRVVTTGKISELPEEIIEGAI